MPAHQAFDRVDGWLMPAFGCVIDCSPRGLPGERRGSEGPRGGEPRTSSPERQPCCECWFPRPS